MKCITILCKFALCWTLFLPAVMLWADEKPVVIALEEIAGGLKAIYATNSEPIPYTVKLEFIEYGHITIDKKLPHYVVIPAKTKKGPVLIIKPVKGKKGFFNYQSTTYSGDCLNVNHNNSYRYLLPFKHGTKHLLEQAYKGGITHVGDSSYAVDFKMPIGTEIYAAREGVVAMVKEDSSKGGMEKKYAQAGNYISVYHNDGSTANYVHLKKNGAIVEKGDVIKAGMLIGYSGNTGLSKGPHLHFEVRIPHKKDYRPVTIPVQFLSPKGNAQTLISNKWYYASHPGKSSFDISLGRLLKNSDYANYQKLFKRKNKVEIRYETIDSTSVYYVGNGHSKPIQLNVDFDLMNMVMSKTNPIAIQVPAEQERFLCLLRPQPPKEAKAIQFKIQSNYKYEYKILK